MCLFGLCPCRSGVLFLLTPTLLIWCYILHLDIFIILKYLTHLLERVKVNGYYINIMCVSHLLLFFTQNSCLSIASLPSLWTKWTIIVVSQHFTSNHKRTAKWKWRTRIWHGEYHISTSKKCHFEYCLYWVITATSVKQKTFLTF